MNSVLDFIQSIQEMKKSQTKWAGLAVSERSQALIKISESIQERSSEIASKLARQGNLPENFILQNEVFPASQRFSKVIHLEPAKDLRPKPTGLISLLLPELFSLRFLAERLAPALFAGNGVFVLVPPSNPVVGEFLNEILDPALPVKVFTGGEDLAEILTVHPGIQAVTSIGAPGPSERILKALGGSWKKWQITSGYHNAALVLNDADLSQAAEKLVESCFIGMGRLPWNISTIYVTEAQLPEFQKLFVSALGKAKFPALSEDIEKQMAALAQQLHSDKAKVLFGGASNEPLVVEDLSHCSVLQQDCLGAPAVLVSAVKYAHEMVKWTNTSYYGMYAQIFGSQEKIEKMATQLEVSRISANSWIETMDELPLGLKQSFSGIPSLHPFGGFFSDLRKIDGLESKN